MVKTFSLLTRALNQKLTNYFPGAFSSKNKNNKNLILETIFVKIKAGRPSF